MVLQKQPKVIFYKHVSLHAWLKVWYQTLNVAWTSLQVQLKYCVYNQSDANWKEASHQQETGNTDPSFKVLSLTVMFWPLSSHVGGQSPQRALKVSSERLTQRCRSRADWWIFGGGSWKASGVILKEKSEVCVQAPVFREARSVQQRVKFKQQREKRVDIESLIVRSSYESRACC